LSPYCEVLQHHVRPVDAVCAKRPGRLPTPLTKKEPCTACLSGTHQSMELMYSGAYA
jgi:hypothetical protein